MHHQGGDKWINNSIFQYFCQLIQQQTDLSFSNISLTHEIRCNMHNHLSLPPKSISTPGICTFHSLFEIVDGCYGDIPITVALRNTLLQAIRPPVPPRWKAGTGDDSGAPCKPYYCLFRETFKKMPHKAVYSQPLYCIVLYCIVLYCIELTIN